MEVHHHPHVEKKGFKEYFLEFFFLNINRISISVNGKMYLLYLWRKFGVKSNKIPYRSSDETRGIVKYKSLLFLHLLSVQRLSQTSNIRRKENVFYCRLKKEFKFSFPFS